MIPVDLKHDGMEGAVCTFLLTGDEPALVDPGPSTTLDTLEETLEGQGMPLEDIRHLLLTHVHLDHAGAAGHLVERVPGLQIHLHEDAAPHLVDPERLVESTRRTFGDDHDRLWGEVKPVPKESIRTWRPDEGEVIRYVRPFHTPGHIDHHVSYLDERTGTLLAGDSMGIILAPDAPTHPPTPPPGVDLLAWRHTLEHIAPIGPERIGVAHFGLHGDFHGRREGLRERLDALAGRIRKALENGRAEEDAEAYKEEVRSEMAEHLPRERVDRYFDVFRAATDYRGLQRYLTRTLGAGETET